MCFSARARRTHTQLAKNKVWVLRFSFVFYFLFFQINVGLCLISLFFVSFRSLVFFFRPNETNQTCAAHALSMWTTTATPADVNARDRMGRTKIYLAAEAGDAAEVARLLESKADLELLTGLFRYVLSFNDEKCINVLLFDSTQLHATSCCLRKRPRASCSFVAQSWREHRSERLLRVCVL